MSLVGAVGAKRLYAKIRKKEGASAWRKVFALEKNVIHLIYFQALLWMITPYWPFAALLAPILLVLDYKWETFSLVRFCKRSATPLADAHKSASLLLGLYLLCLLLFCTRRRVARRPTHDGELRAVRRRRVARRDDVRRGASAGTLLLWLYTFSISPYFRGRRSAPPSRSPSGATARARSRALSTSSARASKRPYTGCSRGCARRRSKSPFSSARRSSASSATRASSRPPSEARVFLVYR